MGNPFSAVINGVEHIGKSMEDLVGKATGELESLGIGMFGSRGEFIQFLIHLGEDPVHVISTLWSHTSGHGGDPFSVLEELANGVLTYGLTNYCTQKANQAVAPIRSALNDHNTRGQQVVNVHQTTLTVTQSKLNTLTGNASAANLPMTWQGAGADAMTTSFSGISQFIEQLNEQMHTNQQQIALNNAFIQGLELTGAVAIGMLVLDILLVAVNAIILVGGTVVAPGVGTLAGAGIDALLDAGVLALELEILAAMVATDALIWLAGTLAIYVTTHPISLNHAMSKSSSGEETTKPSKAECKKAIKLLEQVDRLAQKQGKKLNPKRLAELKKKIADKTITSSDLPGSIQNTEFPDKLKGLTLKEVEERCKGV